MEQRKLDFKSGSTATLRSREKFAAELRRQKRDDMLRDKRLRLAIPEVVVSSALSARELSLSSLSPVFADPESTLVLRFAKNI